MSEIVDKADGSRDPMEQSTYRKWRFKWRGLLQHLPSVRVDDKRKWFVGELQKPVAQGSAHIITDIDANAVTFVEAKARAEAGVEREGVISPKVAVERLL